MSFEDRYPPHALQLGCHDRPPPRSGRPLGSTEVRQLSHGSNLEHALPLESQPWLLSQEERALFQTATSFVTVTPDAGSLPG